MVFIPVQTLELIHHRNAMILCYEWNRSKGTFHWTPWQEAQSESFQTSKFSLTKLSSYPYWLSLKLISQNSLLYQSSLDRCFGWQLLQGCYITAALSHQAKLNLNYLDYVLWCCQILIKYSLVMRKLGSWLEVRVKISVSSVCQIQIA